MFLFRLLQEDPILIIPWIVTIMVSIGVHEFAHALAGYLQGDDTAQHSGRLTLNPLAHVDWMGLILLLLVGFGWGKPTPFNPNNLKFKKWGSALVAMAGPFSNVIMAVVSVAILAIIGPESISWLRADNALIAFLLFMAQINVVLFIFNLIPIPPLDGSKVLYAVLGTRNMRLIYFLESQGPWLLLALIIFGQGVLGYAISFVLAGLYGIFGIL